MVISQIFAQTTIDTLSVTIYPEFSYPGVAIEYKFDKFGSDEIEFPVSSDIDSVLYTVSGDGLEFEQILKTNKNSFQAINQDGNHTIYLFLDRFILIPSKIFNRSSGSIGLLIIPVTPRLSIWDFKLDISIFPVNT